MGRISDDGKWWWDGKAWIATDQVVLPQLPPTEMEQSGKLKTARDRLGKYGPAYAARTTNLAALVVLPFYLRGQAAMRDYRAWTLEQLALATAFLLGPDETMVVGETTLLPPEHLAGSWVRDLALAVTAAHVVVFRIDSNEGQPRWIAVAGRAEDVTVDVRSELESVLRGPALTVSRENAQWVLRGFRGVFDPHSVVRAWQQAVSRNS